jgi:integrase
MRLPKETPQAVHLTKKYANNSKWIMNKVLLPYFGNMRMDKIIQEVVEAFVDSYIQKGYKHTTINCNFSVLKTMLIEAEERKVIVHNPIQKMGKLISNRKEIEVITRDEFKRLFVGDWRRVWENDLIAYTANKLAALTGMRAAEVMGLKGCYVFDEHIFLCMQYDTKYGYRPTKTKDKCNIPLPASMIADLNELKAINGDGFLFSTDGGGKPVSKLTVYLKFHKALVNIGIPKEQIAERKLHLHAWRHFFNTELLKGGLSVKQTQAVTRHRSEQMTDRYAHFEPSDFIKAKEVQEALLQPIAAQKAETAGQNVTVLTFAIKQKEPEQLQKQA